MHLYKERNSIALELTMKKDCMFLCLFVLLSSYSYSQKNSVDKSAFSLRKPTGEPMSTLMNINNISMWLRADGRMGQSAHGGCGVIYPRGTSGVVYADGIVWGGFVKDGHESELRVGGTIYNTGLRPGRIISRGVAEDPHDPNVRVWRIRPDWETADLIRDAAEFFNVSIDSVTDEQTSSIRNQYVQDWNGWPWQKGAPFYDTNNDGIMDEDEEPGIAHADQVVWFVANDLDSTTILYMFENEGSPPIGLEMQVTLWAYNKKGSQLNEAFRNTIFKRVRLIYKGRADTPDTAHIDSMFISQFTDTDIGGYPDDFAGCDTLLDLGYGYNSDGFDIEFLKFDLPPAAFGYTLIQGPLASGDNLLDDAYFDFGTRIGFINLPMTSFFYRGTNHWWRDPHSALDMYNVMNGFLPEVEPMAPFLDPYWNPVKYMVSGDPVTKNGWIDGTFGEWGYWGRGDRRFHMNSGPFHMALGDTQEVIIAMVGGIGSCRLASVSVMKHYVKWVRSWAQHVFITGLEDVTPDMPDDEDLIPQNFHLYPNYPNPFNSGTTIEYDLPLQKYVRLSIYNILGQSVRVLVDETQEPGYYRYGWDGTNDRGERVHTGLYLLRLDTGRWVLTRKMMLLE